MAAAQEAEAVVLARREGQIRLNPLRKGWTDTFPVLPAREDVVEPGVLSAGGEGPEHRLGEVTEAQDDSNGGEEGEMRGEVEEIWLMGGQGRHRKI